MPDELRQKSMLEFVWGIAVGGFSAQETIQVREFLWGCPCCISNQMNVCLHICSSHFRFQASSIRHLLIGCFTGVFALGQVCLLVSRVMDPQNFVLVGVPPEDLLEDIAAALLGQGVDVRRQSGRTPSPARGCRSWICA